MRTLGETLARMTASEKAEFWKRDSDPRLVAARNALALELELADDGVTDGAAAATLARELEQLEDEIVESYLKTWR